MNNRKQVLALCICLLLCVGFCGCGSSNTKSISSYRWSLEWITDLGGKPLFSGSDQDVMKGLDLVLRFDGKDFALENNVSKQTWTGTYSLERVHNVYRLELFFENSTKPVVGVYGTRVYSDNSKKATITLQTDDYILSFIGADL